MSTDEIESDIESYFYALETIKPKKYLYLRKGDVCILLFLTIFGDRYVICGSNANILKHRCSSILYLYTGFVKTCKK
jgi:hypothetical protein